ncbi:hypothetical protein CEXT_343221 [Caerostris extrusa]|uniref:Uncharacterized protein n=1 Tax=Caerostris extrusa TaxID=172846 RepID=A0AAV4RE81_CAEEX|nr:hypothetical protein CEXT_343221 [Caerostris extrusa]
MKETQFFREVEKFPFLAHSEESHKGLNYQFLRTFPLHREFIASSVYLAKHRLRCRPPHKGPPSTSKCNEKVDFFFSTSRDDAFPAEDRAPNSCFKDAPIHLCDQECVLIRLD